MFDGRTRIGTSDGRIVVVGPNPGTVSRIKLGTTPVYAPLMRTVDDGLIALTSYSELALLRGDKVVSHTKLPGYSLVRLAASHTHVFAATTEALVTFDANARTEVMRFPRTAAASGHR